MTLTYVVDDDHKPIGWWHGKTWTCWSSPSDGGKRVRPYRGELLALDLNLIGDSQ